jgi:hypothetical protein
LSSTIVSSSSPFARLAKSIPLDRVIAPPAFLLAGERTLVGGSRYGIDCEWGRFEIALVVGNFFNPPRAGRGGNISLSFPFDPPSPREGGSYVPLCFGGETLLNFLTLGLSGSSESNPAPHVDWSLFADLGVASHERGFEINPFKLPNKEDSDPDRGKERWLWLVRIAGRVVGAVGFVGDPFALPLLPLTLRSSCWGEEVEEGPA